MDFNDFQIPPPKHWQQFENLCLSLFRRIWRHPTAQKNGRSGQPQHGTDISGEHQGVQVGVQCKGKDAGLGAMLTEAELRAEVAKAQNFEPALSRWILATTGPKDARIEEAARLITIENRAAGLFDVQVLGWEDIQSLMSQNVEVIEEHYPDLAPATRIALARLSKALEPPTVDLKETIRTAREAARTDLEKFQRAAGGAKTLELNLETAVAKERQPLGRADLATALRSGKTVLIEAEPGAGKSIALIQLTASLLIESDDDVAAVVLLPELADLGHGLIEDVAGRDAFEGIVPATLAGIARAGRLILLSDGWNELSSDQRDRVQAVLIRFRRDYPGAGLLIATRALSPVPIPDAMRVFLLPTSRDQQLAILSEALGVAAEDFLNRARRMPGMRDLLRTPLYVSVLGEIATTGALPETREEAIHRFIERQERHPEHGVSLRAALQDCHRSYLGEIARYLTVGGAGAISRSALRPVIARVSAALTAAGQFNAPPEPQDITDVLVSHHVLVERPGATANPFYAFQHQQFREWFASFHVEERIAAAAATPMPEIIQLLADLLNRWDWSEPILFAVERLSRASPEGAHAVGLAIRRAIAIDPMLGAVMIRSAAAETWPVIAEPVLRFANAWYQTEERDRAFRFMTGTGRPEVEPCNR